MKKWLLLLWLAAAPALAKESLYVCCTNHMVVMDPVTMNVTAEIPCKGSPAILHANPARTHLYIVDGSRELIEVLDVPSQKIVRTLTLSTKPDALPRTRAFIWGLATDPQEKFLYAYITPTVREREEVRADPPFIAVVDLATGQLVKKVPSPRGVSSMASRVDGTAIYLFGRDIYALNTATLQVTKAADVRHPNIQGEGDCDYILEWLHHREAGEWGSAGYFTEDPPTKRAFMGLLIFDLAKGVMDKLEAGVGPDNFVPFSGLISPDHLKGYLIFNNLMTFDIPKRQLISNVRLPRSYGSMTQNADGTRIYAAGSGSSVLEFDAVGSKVLREVELPYDTFELLMVP